MEEIIGKPEVLQSATGYYIGTLYLDNEGKAWLPYERLSGYYPDEQTVLEDLPNYM